MTAYEYRHVVGFEETSMVGNAYFTNYLRWQGHCREMFLRDHAAGVLAMMARQEVMYFTRHCSCDYKGDWGFRPLDEVVIEMQLVMFRGGRLDLGFEYRNAAQPDVLVAKGLQGISCKARRGEDWVADPFPVPMVEGLLKFTEDPELCEALNDALEYHRQNAPQG